MAPIDKREPRPIIGFLGMVVIIFGCGLIDFNICIGTPLLIVGIAFLVYALFTGNVKFWG